MILGSNSNFKIVCSTRQRLKNEGGKFDILSRIATRRLNWITCPHTYRHRYNILYIYKYTVYIHGTSTVYVYNCQYLHMDQYCMIHPPDYDFVWETVSSTCFFSIFESPKNHLSHEKNHLLSIILVVY